jgi:hypothetical protein
MKRLIAAASVAGPQATTPILGVLERQLVSGAHRADRLASNPPGASPQITPGSKRVASNPASSAGTSSGPQST